MTDKFEFLHDCVERALKGGADHADIYLQSGEGHSAHYEDGRIDEISSSASDGTGCRIISGGRTFYSHTPGCTPAHVSSSFKECAEAAAVCDINASASFSPLLEAGAPISPPALDFFKEIDSSLKKKTSLIRQISYRYTLSHKRIAVIKPDGGTAFDTRFYSSFAVQVIAEKNGLLQTGGERRCFSLPEKDFWGSSAPMDVAEKALMRALLMLDAKPCPAGVMNVLMDGEAGGTIIHEACGHGLEADIVEKDHSVYRGRTGQKVARECVTMVDDATLPGLYGSFSCDDEGTPAQRTVLIENGILKRYMTDVLSARLYGLPLTGNGRRESYRCIPLPRMSNTFLMPGSDDFDTMLEKTGSGLYVKKMGGGEVDPTSGDFVFYITEGYLIEKGRITTPVRGAILTGNGPRALANISALGHNLTMDPGICGKSGQGVPVTDGQPSMLIEGLTVGGSEV
ncbi:MAG: TldD/PmbA family protein [Synergistes sp.]|nr:TldD/PmbA family protein [Synergistes sp.]